MAKAKAETPKDAKSSKQSTLASFFGAPKPGARPPSTKPSNAASSPAQGSQRPASSIPGSSPLARTVRATQGDDVAKTPLTAKSTYVASEEELTPPPESGPSSSAQAESNVKAQVVRSPEAAGDVDMRAGDNAAADGSPVAVGRRAKRKVMYVESDSEASSGEDIRATKPVAAKGRKPRKSLKADSDSDEFVFDDADEAAMVAAAEEYEASVISRSPSAAFSASPEPIKRKAQAKKGFAAPKSVPRKTTSSWNRASSPSGSSPVSRPGPRPVSRPSMDDDSRMNSGTAGRSAESSSFLLTAAERKKLEAKEAKRESEQCYDFLLDVKDKEGNRPGDPDYDPRTIFIPKKSWNEFTPFEKQFWEIKQDHYDTVLFFQKGKFYELYENDALIGHQDFDLKLTDRVKMKMVGVPEQSLEFWVQKFLGAGHKVGKVDQEETAIGMEMRTKSGAKSGGREIVRRELKQVFTNGTIVDGTYLSSDEANHCVAIKESVSDSSGISSFGICVMDASTGSFDLCAFEDDICRTRLETMFRQIRPKELVYAKDNLSVATLRMLRNILPQSTLWQSFKDGKEFCSTAQTLVRLSKFFSVDGEEEDGKPPLPDAIQALRSNAPAMEALGGLLFYLKTLHLDEDLVSQRNFDIYDPISEGKILILDGQTLGHMEVLVNGEGGVEGTLWELLQRCTTPSGKRLFRLWLTKPLRDAKDINERLDAIDDLLKHPAFAGDFTQLCKGLPDLERFISRIHAGSSKQGDFLRVIDSFAKLQKGIKSLRATAEHFDSPSIGNLLRTAPDVSEHLARIRSMYNVEEDGKSIIILPSKGADSTCDEADAAVEAIEATLDEIKDEAEKKIGKRIEWWDSSLGNKEIRHFQVASNVKTPANWTKQSGTKAYNRYTTPESARAIRQLQEARETQSNAKKMFFARLLIEFDNSRDIWLNLVRVVAELDCLVSLAKASSDMPEPKCRPEFVASPSAFVIFTELRHPSMSLRADFIANDVQLGGAQPRQVLLTGPNMAGKSTLLRMTAAGVIMAQLGCYVPAATARLSPVDRIQTRMGAYDNMFASASTFKVELDECSKILREAGPKSLVILDELGRGTSTYDGMAIAGAVLHHLATHTLPLGFFATHYGSLTDDFTYHPNIRKMHMQTHVDDELKQVVFLYKLIPGVAESSHGTHVARMAGVPLEVVTRAEDVSDQFFADFNAKLSTKRQSNLPLEAQADFAWLMKLVLGRGTGTATDDVSDQASVRARGKAQMSVIRRAVAGYVKV
ncbi:hypothetical protein IAU60_000365 [Kwoniella sp. DSM 27419]